MSGGFAAAAPGSRFRRFGAGPYTLSFSVIWLAICLTTAFGASAYASQQVGLILIYGLLALSFTFVWGLGGVFSLCQTALFGIGAYTYGVVSVNLQLVPAAGFFGLFAGACAATIVAAVLGWFLFYGRMSGMYVAVATLAFNLILLTFMNGTAGPQYRIGSAALGGQNGMVGMFPLSWSAAADSPGFSLPGFLIFVGFLNLLATLCIGWCTRMPWFRVVLAVKENELRARTLGFDSRASRLLLFSVAAAVAGLAGAEYGAQQLYVNTNVFTLSTASLVIIWVLLGGRTSITGAYFGVAIIEGLTLALASVNTSVEAFISGLIMIATVTFFPGGIISLLERGFSRIVAHFPGQGGRPTVGRQPGDGQKGRSEGFRREALKVIQSTLREAKMLNIAHVSKSFGGTRAVSEVAFQVSPRSITSVVGPNGAGKSTLFHLISGRLRPDGGDIEYGADRMSSLPLESRITAGIAIKYQAPQLFPTLSVEEHLWLAAYGASKDRKQAHDEAAALLAFIGLGSKSHVAANELAHGDSQRLDIAMALASRPSLLLLDEPTAGLNPEEIRQLGAMLTALKGLISVVVITHDFQFVASLDAPVVVMSRGSVFRIGSVKELREDNGFIDLYLGRDTASARAD